MKMGAGIAGAARAMLAASLLVACAQTAPPRAPAPPPAPAPISAESTELAGYYAQVQQTLLSQGLLRTDGGGDMPLNDQMLATNFLRIALYEEYGAGLQKSSPVTLTRWSGPVRVGLTFGASVPPARQAADRAKIASYLARLSRLTGHNIALSSRNPNFFITIADVDERRALGPALQRALPELNPAQVAGVTDLDRATYCLVWTQSDGATGQYDRAFVFIPSEHPDLMRLACIHEEIAQGLGLPNDSGLNRPSIFNDDEEFALLTRQDELMLRILYDPALTPGMTEAQARPIVQTLASRLLGGNS